MTSSLSRALRVAALGLGLGSCAPPAGAGDPAIEPTVRALVPATDLDPDPRVVEIELEASPGVATLAEGVETSVLAYRDGPTGVASVPGPLIEATVGDRLVVHFRNGLPALRTTVHWHGLRLPVEMDGNPMVSGSVAPGEGFEYDFVLRDAGLHWYHPHVDTDVQLELGLQGMLLVHEADPPVVDRERIFALDDVSLDADGSIDVSLSADDAMLGRRGEVVTVNGGPPGTIVARPGSLERWRLVDTANGRYFAVVAEGLEVTVIGTDGGMLAQPHAATRLLLAPGERLDLLVRMPEDSTTVPVRTEAFDRGLGHVDAAALLWTVEVDGEPVDTPMPELERTLAPLAEPAQTRRFEVSSRLEGPGEPVFFINDERWPLNTPLEVVSGDVDAWEVVNDEDHHHPFHVHGLFFQVLGPDGASLEQGWKDTIDVPPRSTIRLAVPYDEPGTWMFHCQIPEHAERGMMGDLVVAPR
ncbi:MAG: multicopper oxidase family protein [Myxococcales bacterium]|nr:multicopper oxidase family protein [Myxococcales bacterium]